MRAREYLLEYNRQITLQKLGPALSKVDHNLDPEEILSSVEAIDPSRNKQYVVWLVRNLVNGQFRLEDADRVQQVLVNFDNVKQRLPVNQRDIGRTDFYGLENLIDQVYNIKLKTGDEQETGGTFPVVPGSKVLYNGPLGQLAIPETFEASKELGSGTRWCTTGEPMYNRYSSQGPLYVWRDKSGDKYQWHMPSDQFKDAGDHEVKPEVLQHLVMANPVLRKFFENYKTSITQPKEALSYIRRFGGNKRDPSLEPILVSTPHSAYEYAYLCIKGRWPEGEATIAKDPTIAFQYASNIIKGRWPEGEDVIATAPGASYHYAKEVVKGRFPAGEEAIATIPLYSYEYAVYVIKGRFPEGEATLARRPEYAYKYATDVLKQRWPECKVYIFNSPAIAKEYIKHFKISSHNAGDLANFDSPEAAYWFAKNIEKGRVLKAEPIILTSPEFTLKYIQFLHKAKLRFNIANANKLLHEAEEYIVNKKAKVKSVNDLLRAGKSKVRLKFGNGGGTGGTTRVLIYNPDYVGSFLLPEVSKKLHSLARRTPSLQNAEMLDSIYDVCKFNKDNLNLNV